MAVLCSPWTLFTMRRGIAAALIALVGASEGPPAGLPADFLSWVAEYGRSYLDEAAWQKALVNFRAAEVFITKLNSDVEDGAIYGHTRFSDMSPEDFKATFLPRTLNADVGRAGGAPYEALPVNDLPAAVDWRTAGAVTTVKDQSSCGSCWAEIGNIESRWYLARKDSGLKAPVSLSVQQVIECDAHDYACYGGFPKGAFQYVIEHGGIASNDDYPYGVDGIGHTICLANQTFNQTCGDGLCDDPPLTSYCDLTCSDTTHKTVATITSWQALPEDEVQMAAQLAANGPLSVGLDAAGSFGIIAPWLQFYKSGVANPKHCTTTVDHGVLLVGYGEDNNQPYWTIKNSWGAKWGEAGYFRLLKGQKKCAIDTLVSTAVIDKLSHEVPVVV